ncbi:MAG: hypothetical protein ACLTTU_11615 [Bilophila wadsworthia]
MSVGDELPAGEQDNQEKQTNRAMTKERQTVWRQRHARHFLAAKRLMPKAA